MICAYPSEFVLKNRFYALEKRKYTPPKSRRNSKIFYTLRRCGVLPRTLKLVLRAGDTTADSGAGATGCKGDAARHVQPIALTSAGVFRRSSRPVSKAGCKRRERRAGDDAQWTLAPGRRGGGRSHRTAASGAVLMQPTVELCHILFLHHRVGVLFAPYSNPVLIFSPEKTRSSSWCFC